MTLVSSRTGWVGGRRFVTLLWGRGGRGEVCDIGMGNGVDWWMFMTLVWGTGWVGGGL